MIKISFSSVFVVGMVGWLCASLIARADDVFTAAEKQQISIATPGLFCKSPSFSVDFGQVDEEDYCFPLPVGKAHKKAPYGMTITTQPGDAVKAMFGGTVRLARSVGGYGSTVIVRHSNGLETVYSHLKGATVKVGQRVKAGQTIAIVDTGGECHVDIMVNGCAINVETILSLHSHKLRRRTLLFTSRGNAVDIKTLEEENRADQPDINLELDADFTAYEQRVVSAPTKGLFAKSNSISIDLSKYGEAQWSYPLPGAKVISPFGGRRRHSGVDLKTKPNDDIKSMFDGIVRFSGRYSGYGNVVVVRHENGLETLYSHNSKNLVKVGDRVKAGQTIALTGRTGRATTEHCHFEIRINGKTYDPSRFLDYSQQSLRKVTVKAFKSGSLSIK